MLISGSGWSLLPHGLMFCTCCIIPWLQFSQGQISVPNQNDSLVFSFLKGATGFLMHYLPAISFSDPWLTNILLFVFPLWRVKVFGTYSSDLAATEGLAPSHRTPRSLPKEYVYLTWGIRSAEV